MNKNRVCPVENSGSLDNIFRKIVHNPKRLFGNYIKDGMTVLDIGCGPGLFSIEIAKMVGETGRVYAADLQEGMLEKVRKKLIKNPSLKNQVILHKTPKDSIGINEKVDFVLAFYLVHEVPDQKKFFKELRSILKSEGKIIIIEPKFHVTKKDFNQTLEIVNEVGLNVEKFPKILFSRSVVLKK